MKFFNFKKTFYLILFFLFSVFLNSCGTVSKITSGIGSQFSEAFGKKKKKEEEPLLAELLREAEKNFAKGNYERAYEAYKEIRDKFPGSPQAVLAELRMADSKFWQGEYLQAIALYEEFEKFYPNNEAIPYVIYQIGTCYYKMKRPYDRDQSYTKKAISIYQRLLQNFPKSPYKAEAEKRIKELRELLAQHELYVAKFYYKIKYYRGAYQRILYIINNYPDTYTSKEAQKLVLTYYQKALLETKELAERAKKDFWGDKYP
ncbi:MAG: Outer membrane protein assembly factor BamD [Thermodesulfobacterium sp.]|uniref:Outer membrane protein assembly factor BamD n=1 Tax=Candidatus Thermodesulfobacterium syntrophicum TaxID=3060442 RepID=A0AAE3TFH9_9BACT|nr:Outer membrane protein assembly factor BamD [Candidatus Thermodesulfobacterium syntrophicum]